VKTTPGMKNIVKMSEEFEKDEREGFDFQERDKKKGRFTQMSNLKTSDIPVKESANI
jgi:hypothetical protein